MIQHVIFPLSVCMYIQFFTLNVVFRKKRVQGLKKNDLFIWIYFHYYLAQLIYNFSTFIYYLTIPINLRDMFITIISCIEDIYANEEKFLFSPFNTSFCVFLFNYFFLTFFLVKVAKGMSGQINSLVVENTSCISEAKGQVSITQTSSSKAPARFSFRNSRTNFLPLKASANTCAHSVINKE